MNALTPNPPAVQPPRYGGLVFTGYADAYRLRCYRADLAGRLHTAADARRRMARGQTEQRATWEWAMQGAAWLRGEIARLEGASS